MFRASGKRVFRSLSYLFLFVLLFFLSVPSPFALANGAFGGRPAYPDPENPRTSSIFIHDLEVGEVADDGIRVINNSDEAKNILVYGVDSTPSTGGAFACKQFSQDKEAVGSWIELEKSEVSLEPGTNEVVPFTISVPTNASVGEHNGCIVIQERKEEDEKKAGVSLSFRTGIRVAITVPGELKRDIEIIGFTVSKKEKGDSKGALILHPMVKNLGNVSVDADVKVITRSVFGFKHAEHGGQYPILRGDTSDWNFELEKPFWGGLYRSSFTVEYDPSLEAGVGVQSGGELLKLKGPSVWFFSMPTVGGLIIEIIILLALVALLFLRSAMKRRKKWIKNSWVDYSVKDGDDINSLSQKFNISWKLLVKVNKLKPPYALKKSQKIKVPPKG